MNEETIVGEPVYYERLYKTTGMPGKVFRYVDVNKDSILFNEFEEDDVRYWIEDGPKLVRRLETEFDKANKYAKSVVDKLIGNT